MQYFRNYPSLLLIFAVLSVYLAGCWGNEQQMPLVTTVVITLPVEATRLVEVTRVVEVTRIVLATQPATTPAPTAAVGPLLSSTPTATPLAVTPRFTPEEKYAGYTPIVLHNQSENRLEVVFDGADRLTAILWQGDRQKIWLREGKYDYIVYLNGQEKYRGALRLVSADKYDLFLKADKAIIWSP